MRLRKTGLTHLRFLNFMLAFALVGTFFLHLTFAASAGWHYPDEADFVNRINSRRGSLGLNGLYWSGCMTNAARDHAKVMSDYNSITHSDIAGLLTKHCGGYGYMAGENVGGFHVSVESAWSGPYSYMSSPCHQANIDSRTFVYNSSTGSCNITGGYGSMPWTHVGVGSWRRVDGTISSVQLFVNATDTRYGNFNQAVNANPVPSYKASSIASTSPQSYTILDSGVRAKADFNGDGKDDVAAIYNYGNANTSLFVFTSTGSSFSPSTWWNSGAGNWDAARTKLTAGDFTGDGKADVAAFYYYGNSLTNIFIFKNNGTSFTPSVWWSSGAGNWNGDLSRPIAGDFNGDGKMDLAALYDYGNANTSLFMFTNSGSSFSPKTWWNSGAGNWDAARTKLTAGDFTGDGKADVAAMYDYGKQTTSMFVFSSNGTSFSPKNWWSSGRGNWDATRSDLTAGDFTGDGKADLGSIYNYGNHTAALFVFPSNGSSFTNASWWSSGAGNWDATRGRSLAGDFTGDGKADVATMYDYGNQTTAMFVFASSGSNFTLANWWSSGAGNWSAPNSRVTYIDWKATGLRKKTPSSI